MFATNSTVGNLPLKLPSLYNTVCIHKHWRSFLKCKPFCHLLPQHLKRPADLRRLSSDCSEIEWIHSRETASRAPNQRQTSLHTNQRTAVNEKWYTRAAFFCFYVINTRKLWVNTVDQMMATHTALKVCRHTRLSLSWLFLSIFHPPIFSSRTSRSSLDFFLHISFTYFFT